MEESLKKLLLFGTFLIVLEVTHQTGSTYYIHEYILVTQPRRSWTEAQSYCREQYGDLATISNVQVNSRIADMAKDWEEPFWIGLYDDVNSWKWSLMGERHYTGVLEDYRQWQEDQPDNAGANEHCVSMMEDGFWRDNSCTFVKLPLICFTDGGSDPYLLVTEPKSWFEAQSYCRQHHTDLVSVRSPAENQELRSRLQADQAVQEAWIGLHRDAWEWSDGSSSAFRQWWPDQPNNENNSQSCATMHKGSWDNWKCDTEFSILCQNITEVTPAPQVGPTTIGQAVLRRTTVKMRLQTSSDLNDSTIRREILQQLEAAFHLQGLTNIKLIWRTLRPEPQPTKTDACGERIEKKLN